jgi:undecaprenyl diphosphate synthase
MCPNNSKQGIHVAIIMDGNGRWATNRGLSRSDGHCQGVKTVRRIVEASKDRDIGVLTLFAFSVDNWRRPREEVSAIFQLMEHYLDTETPECVERGIRITIIGQRQGLSLSLRSAIDRADLATRHGRNLWLRIALNYSARDAILAAADRARREPVRSRKDFARLLSGTDGETAPDVDLLIRTGGERRLSDFLLWECAYAEMYFTDVSWPEFTPQDLDAALADFHHRDRRFGAAPSPITVVAANESWLF